MTVWSIARVFCNGGRAMEEVRLSVEMSVSCDDGNCSSIGKATGEYG